MPISQFAQDIALHDSFFVCSILFFGLTLITVIEALRTKNPVARNIMNLESAISLVAGYVYTSFVRMSREPNTTYADIIKTRYYDWFVTTPLMLLVLVVFFSYESQVPVKFPYYMAIIILNFGMLYSGFKGDTGDWNKNYAGALGFVFFFAMFAVIYFAFVRGHGKLHRIEGILLSIFIVVWSCYGIIYYLKDESLRNRLNNVLDVIAKIFVGLFLWAYVSGLMEF